MDEQPEREYAAAADPLQKKPVRPAFLRQESGVWGQGSAWYFVIPTMAANGMLSQSIESFQTNE